MYFLIIEMITVYQSVSIHQRNWSCIYAYVAIRVFAEAKYRKLALRSRLPELLLIASTSCQLILISSLSAALVKSNYTKANPATRRNNGVH